MFISLTRIPASKARYLSAGMPERAESSEDVQVGVIPTVEDVKSPWEGSSGWGWSLEKVGV